MSDWHRVDNQPPMTGLEMKNFLTNYSNNLAKGLEIDMIGGSSSSASKKAYCMSCKKKQTISNPSPKKCNGKRNVLMIQGQCSKCKTKVSVFVSDKKQSLINLR